MRFIVCLLILSGCSTFSTNEKVPLNIPDQEPLVLENVEFTDNFCLDEQNFKKLLLNLKQIEQYITLNNKILEKYKNYCDKNK